jgi:hypothetical protein
MVAMLVFQPKETYLKNYFELERQHDGCDAMSKRFIKYKSKPEIEAIFFGAAG